jgi:hypothetical protein
MPINSSLLAKSRGRSRVSSFFRNRWIVANSIAFLGACLCQQSVIAQTPPKSQQTDAAAKAIQGLKAQVAAICKSFPKDSQSDEKVSAVLAAVAQFLKTNPPEMAAEVTQAVITVMGATKAEVGALVKGIAQLAPGQIQAIANGALVVAADAIAEIQAAVPGVAIGPGDPLGSPTGGEVGGAGGAGGFTPPINVPKASQTDFKGR